MSTLRTAISQVLLLALLASGSHALREKLIHSRPESGFDSTSLYLPNINSVRILSLGFENVLADVLWFQTINYFGKQTREHLNLEWFGHMCELVTTLDSRALHAYEFCSTLLSWVAKQPEISERLLARGVQVFPQYWRLRYLRGFNAWYFLDDKEQAARELKVAAALPGAPLFLTGLASKLLVGKNNPDVAVQFLQEMLRKTHNEDARRELQEKLKRAELAHHLAVLGEASQVFRSTTGRTASSVQELVDAKIINIIPTEPFGGRYEILPTGGIQTTSGEEPLTFVGKTAATGILSKEFQGK